MNTLGIGDWNEYINRRRGKEWSIHPERMPYMADTVGTMTYQEQYLLDAKTFAGWTIAYADKHLRKNYDIRNDDYIRNKFINDSISNGYDEDFITSLWCEIEDAIDGGYSFNKAHSASYAMISFQTAWLKYYYPVEFYASLMTSKGGDQDEISALIAECKEKGISILPPDINSANEDFVPKENGIQYRMTTITHVGATAIKEIYRLRPIKSLEDLLERRIKSKLKNNVIVSLIKAGTMDSLNPNRTELMWEFDQSQRTKTQIKEEYEHPRYENNPEKILEWEKESLGIYLSAHPMDKYSFKPLDSFANEGDAFIGGQVMSVSKGLQKNGEEMAFISLDTKFGVVRVLVFASIWKDVGVKMLFNEDNFILVRGRRSGDSLLFNSGEELI